MSRQRARSSVWALALALMLALFVATARAADPAPAGSDETTAVTDDVSVLASPFLNVDETVGAHDSFSSLPGALVNANESVAASDTASFLPGALVNANERIAASDAPLFLAGALVNANEHVTASDAPAFLPGVLVGSDEAIRVGDSAAGQVVNAAPVVTLGPLADLSEGDDLVASGSFTDPDPQDWRATVDYGDGSGIQALPLAAKTFDLRHRYVDNGTFTVEVVVSDTLNGAGSARQTVKVRNVAPTAVLTADAAVDEGGSAAVSLGQASDLSPVDMQAGFTYAFDCGGGYSAFGPGAATQCPFDDGLSTHSVRAKIRDKDGGESEYSASVMVRNVPPTARLLNNGPVAEGSPATISFADVHDASQADTSAGFTLSYACDGVTFAPDSHCTFDDGQSSHTVKARIADKDGGVTELQTTVEVTNAPPDGTLTNSGPVNEGSPVTISFAGVTDPSATDRSAGFAYAFACDGLTFAPAAAASSTSCSFDDGDSSHVVKGRITDKDGGTVERATTVSVRNAAPTATLDVPATASEGASFQIRLLSPHDASLADTAAGFTYAFDCGDGAGLGAFAAAASRSCPADDNGLRPVQAAIRDKDGGTTTYPASVQVQNVAPTARLVVPATPVAEGATFTVALADGTDVSGADRLAGFTYAFDCGSGYGPASAVAQVTCTAVNDPGVTVKARIADKDAGSTEYSAPVAIQNLPPAVTITQPAAQTIVPTGTSVSFAGTFTDAGRTDTHTAQWSFDAAAAPGTVAESNGAGTVTVTRAFPSAGVYTVTLKVTDTGGAVGTAARDSLVVVYDTNGSVTGSGWVSVPGGKAEFAGNASFKKGAGVQGTLTVTAPGVNFASTSVAWLVAARHQAQYYGAGTLNGAAGATFLATEVDASPALFRVVIWRADGTIALDTSPGAPLDVDVAAPRPLGGGSIQVR